MHYAAITAASHVSVFLQITAATAFFDVHIGCTPKWIHAHKILVHPYTHKHLQFYTYM